MGAVEHVIDLTYGNWAYSINVPNQGITFNENGHCRLLVLDIFTNPATNISQLRVYPVGLNDGYGVRPAFGYNPASDFFTTNLITEEQYNNYVQNQDYWNYDNKYPSYVPESNPHIGNINCDVPIYTTQAVMQKFNTIFPQVQINGDIRFVDVSSIQVGDLIYYPMAYKEQGKITHHVYIDGAGKDADITIKTESTFEESVTTNICVGIRNRDAQAHVELNSFGKAYNYNAPIVDYTYGELGNLGCKNTGILYSLVFNEESVIKPQVIFYFKNQVGEEILYSKIGCISWAGQGSTYELSTKFGGDPDAEEDSTFVRIVFHTGKLPDEERDDDGDDPDEGGDRPYNPDDPDDTPDDGDGDDDGSLGSFFECWRLTDVESNLLKDSLWTQSYFNVLKVNENPIENIITSKRFPFVADSIGHDNIRIGNIDMGVGGYKIAKGIWNSPFVHQTVTRKYHNFLDVDCTNLAIFLPYIGFKQLDTKLFMGHDIGVKYKVDVVAGNCRALIYRNGDGNGRHILEFDGMVGVDAPLTASNQKQAELGNIFRLVNSAGAFVGGVMAQNVAQGMSGIEGFVNNKSENHFQSTSTSSAISTNSRRQIFLIYDRPVPLVQGTYPSEYKRTVGIPTGLSLRVASEIGKNEFFKCGGDVKLSSFDGTKDEEMMIKQLLTTGVVK